MSTKLCSICKAEIDGETAPILVMGGFGNPRLLCGECSDDIETVTRGREPDAIELAVNRVSDKMTRANSDDRLTLETVTQIFADSAERAKKIKEGTYDFSLDDTAASEEFLDIPEDMRETEEDRLLDEKEAAASSKFDKIFTYVSVAVFVLAIGYFILSRFIL